MRNKTKDRVAARLATAMLAVACVGCTPAEPPRTTRVSSQMSQAELRRAAASANEQLLAFADCLEGGDPAVDPANYPVCLRRHVDGLSVVAAGVANDLLRIAGPYEERMQSIADEGAVADDEDLIGHYAAITVVMHELAAEVRALAATGAE